MFLIYLIVNQIVQADSGFFVSVAKHLGCQYACSLIAGCAKNQGSVCERDTCTNLKRGLDGICLDCDGIENVTCDEALHGYLAEISSVTSGKSIPSPAGDSSLWFLPEWLSNFWSQESGPQ
jgi:hypothetical protein